MSHVQRLAIIGTGAMGFNHARTAQMLHNEVELTHVADPIVERAQHIVAEFGNSNTRVHDSADDLDGENTDLAIIASPSHLHAEQAAGLLSRGVNVLVEKPVALSIADAERLSEVANHTDKVLMVGHVELFNPVVKELRCLLGQVALRSLRFKRLGFVDDQSRLYHDVVSDLMLHDLSIANQLVDPLNNLNEKVVYSFARKDTMVAPDPAEAIVDYGNGVDAHFRASRAYPGGKVRRVEAETDEGVFDADLLLKEITKRTAGEGLIAKNGTYVQDIRTTSFFAQEDRTPLELEQLHFIRSTQGHTSPEEGNVSLADAFRILELTERILQQLEK